MDSPITLLPNTIIVATIFYRIHQLVSHSHHLMVSLIADLIIFINLFQVIKGNLLVIFHIG